MYSPEQRCPRLGSFTGGGGGEGLTAGPGAQGGAVAPPSTFHSRARAGSGCILIKCVGNSPHPSVCCCPEPLGGWCPDKPCVAVGPPTVCPVPAVGLLHMRGASHQTSVKSDTGSGAEVPQDGPAPLTPLHVAPGRCLPPGVPVPVTLAPELFICMDSTNKMGCQEWSRYLWCINTGVS